MSIKLTSRRTGRDLRAITLNTPVLSAKERALKIAADALETIGESDGDTAEFARDELARVRTLVPEIG
jgi:hypothetical protein